MFSFHRAILWRGVRASNLMNDIVYNTKDLEGILNKFEIIVNAKDFGSYIIRVIIS